MRWRISLVVALALFVAVGCDQQPVEPQTAEVAQAPAFNFMNGPESAGRVMRWEGGWVVGLWDEGTELQAYIGVDIADYCAGGGSFDIVEFNTVEWDEFGRWKDTYHGTDMATSVWPFPEFDCGLFTATDPLASGLSTLRGTDNDVVPWATESPRTNSWGYRAHGALYDAADKKHQFSAYEQCTWHDDAVQADEDPKCRYKVQLK